MKTSCAQLDQRELLVKLVETQSNLVAVPLNSFVASMAVFSDPALLQECGAFLAGKGHTEVVIDTEFINDVKRFLLQKRMLSGQARVMLEGGCGCEGPRPRPGGGNGG